MEQVNPGIAKGYALDFASPLRFVAERLDARPRTLDELWREYEHDPGDLSRVWQHELRRRGQRKSSRGDVQEQREADAKRWLLEAAIGALGEQVRREDDRFVLAVPLDDVRVRGLPVAYSPRTDGNQPDSPRRTRGATARGGAGGRESGARSPKARKPASPPPKPEPEPPTPEPEPPAPEPEPPNPLEEWVERNDYTRERLALALGLEPAEVASYLEGARPVPRVVWLALWALERGAEVER